MGSWYIQSERIFTQDSDPGAVGSGALWSDTNANITYRRNDANTDWIPTTISLGTAYQNLSVNSGATAQAYQASLQSLMTAQGDVIYASAANTPARLAKGTASQVLKMNSGATAPEWASGAALTSQYAEVTADQTFSSATLTDITSLTLTMPNTTKKAVVTATVALGEGTSAYGVFSILDNTTVIQSNAQYLPDGNTVGQIVLTIRVTCSGQVVKVQGKTDAGSITVLGANEASQNSTIVSMEGFD